MGMLKLLYLVGFNVGESMVTSDNSAIVRAGHIDFLGAELQKMIKCLGTRCFVFMCLVTFWSERDV